MSADVHDWINWIDLKGNGGYLEINNVDLLPPGARETFEPLNLKAFVPLGMPLRRPSAAEITEDGGAILRVDLGLASEGLSSQENGTIRRTIDLGRKTATHEMFAIPLLLQNSGHAKRMIRVASELYEELGIETVELQAEGVGKYAWGRCGFDFEDHETREAVNVAMRLFAEEIGLTDDLPEFAHPWQVATLDYDDDGVRVEAPPERLADALKERGEIQLIGQRVLREGLTPSKALLIYSRYDSWDGLLDLRKGSPGLDQMLSYTREFK